jgi:Mlc titration factor MtfA (ptsG expression regulator)
MSPNLEQLLATLSPQEQARVEAAVAKLIRRKQRSRLRRRFLRPGSTSSNLAQRLATLSPQEQARLEAAVAKVLLAQRQPSRIPSDDLSAWEWTKLVATSGSFDWLAAEAEDVYTVTDGQPVQWPQP